MLQAIARQLAGIYDVPLAHDLEAHLVRSRDALPGTLRQTVAEEQLVVAQDGDTVFLGLYLAPALLERLGRADPLRALHGGNIGDYWTVLEGVSHFLYVAWNAGHDRPVSLLELELQAEVDKYVSSLWLLRAQDPRRFPAELHPLLFREACVDPLRAGERAPLYHHANRYAARFCRGLAQRLRGRGPAALAAVTADLRRFYRLDRNRKLRHIERGAA